MKFFFYSFGGILLLFLSSIFIQSCAIQPSAWTPPIKPTFEGVLQLNEALTKSQKIDLKGWNGPEEFVFDAQGNAYCGVHKGAKTFKEGAILKISPDGVVSEWLRTKGWVTGMDFNASGALIALINNIGLVEISKDKQVKILLAKDPKDQPILMGSGLKIASNGKIYFANLSSKQSTSPKYINKLILEQKLEGGLYCYDPNTKQTTTISDGNYFANGLALSQDESFLLLSETSKYRILKYWLKGPQKGSSEVFLENLPGFPNNISLRENGHFWLGFTTKRNDQLDQIHSKRGLKKLVYGLPSFVQPKADSFGMILEIDEQGTILQALFDPKGEVIQEAGAVKEFNKQLYIGGDVQAFAAIFDLDTSN